MRTPPPVAVVSRLRCPKRPESASRPMTANSVMKARRVQSPRVLPRSAVTSANNSVITGVIPPGKAGSSGSARRADLRLCARDRHAALHQLDDVAVRVLDVGLQHAVAAGPRPADHDPAALADPLEKRLQVLDLDREVAGVARFELARLVARVGHARPPRRRLADQVQLP